MTETIQTANTAENKIAKIAGALEANKDLRDLMRIALDSTPEAIKAVTDFLTDRRQHGSR